MSLSKQQFIRNSVWTFFELALYPLLMIAATPVFIEKLGIEQYGLWMLVSTITLGMNVLNIGVGDTNVRLISKYRAENNFALIQRVFNFNFSLSVFLCISACVAGLVFYFSSFISIFYKTADYHFANTILLLACYSAGVKFVEIAILSVFKAYERFDINSKLAMLSKNSTMLLSLTLVILDYDLLTVFRVSLIGAAANVLLQLIVLSRFKPGIIEIPGFAFFKEKLSELNYNFWYWLQSVVALLGFLSDKLMVAYFTDIKTMGYYSIASLIGSQIHNFFLSFGSFIFPRVSFKLAEKKDIARIYFVSRSIIALSGWSIIVFLILAGDLIFRLWLGTETFINSIYFIKLYLVFEAGMLLIIVPFYFINGTLYIRLNSLFEVTIRSSHFLATLAGFYLAGVNGMLFGLILSTFLNIPFQYYLFHRKIMPSVNSLQYLWVIVPVVFMFGLVMSSNIIFQLSLIVCLFALCKFIYFDPARQYSRDTFFFRRLLGRMESK